MLRRICTVALALAGCALVPASASAGVCNHYFDLGTNTTTVQRGQPIVVNITDTRSSPSASASVLVSTIDSGAMAGTAVAGTDYSSQSGTAVGPFATTGPNPSTQSLSIPTGTSGPAGSRTVKVHLIGTTGSESCFNGTALAYTLTDPPAGGSLPLPPAVASVSPSAASAGTVVDITGTRFGGVSKVLFGALPATFTVDTYAHMTATVPAGGSGTVDVRVVAPGGTSPVNSGDTFTYLATAGSTSAGDLGQLPAGPQLLCTRIPTLVRHTVKGARHLLDLDGCTAPLDVSGDAPKHKVAHITAQRPVAGTPLFVGDRIAVTIG